MKTLFSPLQFPSGAQAENRIWLAPLTNLQSHADGSLSTDELRWLQRRAEGGFGIIETCAAYVAKDGQGWAGELGVAEDRHLPGLHQLATTLQPHRTLSIVQLFHGGLRADPSLTGESTWSATAFAEPGLTPARAATEEDLTRVIGQFRDAAVRCYQAGINGVELHGAHGYLLGQFLSTVTNTRTDGWGGSFAGRARLLREVTRAVRSAVPSSFTVGVRISPEDWGQAKGLDLDESLQLARWLVEDGIDFLHISLWNAAKKTKKRPDAHPLTLFRGVVPASLPLVAAGAIWTRAEAEALLALGADAVALGRAAIVNPDWPRQIQDAAWQPVRPPVTTAVLRAAALSDTFVSYLRKWSGFISD